MRKILVFKETIRQLGGNRLSYSSHYNHSLFQMLRQLCAWPVSQVSLLILRQMTWYLQSLLLLHQFSPGRWPTCIQTVSCNQCRGSRRSPSSTSSASLVTKKQSQSWRTESLQGSSGINRFDPYWKENCLWEGGLWDITITEEAEGLCRGGSPEPRILADLAVMVRERFMLLCLT